MEKRKFFVFYRSFYDAVRLLEPEQRLEAILAICEYGLDGRRLHINIRPIIL